MAETAEQIPLRVVLKEMSDDLEQATDAHREHLRRCACRGRCKAALALGGQVIEAQRRLALTRFVNEDG